MTLAQNYPVLTLIPIEEGPIGGAQIDLDMDFHLAGTLTVQRAVPEPVHLLYKDVVTRDILGRLGRSGRGGRSATVRRSTLP